MLRWYDFVLALIAADFLLAGVLYSITADAWWKSLIGGFAALAIWDMWNGYCMWRKGNET